MNRRPASVAWLCLALAACSRERGGEIIEREGEPPVSMVNADDDEMRAAIRKAQVSLDEFERRLAHPPPTQSYISLKGRIESSGVVEHMWLNDVEVIPSGYRGTIGNEPLELADIALGQEVAITREQVSDWMAIDDGHLIAGYSVRLLRDRLPPDEREQFDAQTGFIID